MQGGPPVSKNAEHVSEPTQSVHSESLSPPGAHTFDATYHAAAGMRAGLSSAGLRQPPGYNWDDDLLASGVHGTVVRVERNKGGEWRFDWVYVRSDDGSRKIKLFFS